MLIASIAGVMVKLHSAVGLEETLPEECLVLVEDSAPKPRADVHSFSVTVAKPRENSGTKRSFSLLFIEALIALALI